MSEEKLKATDYVTESLKLVVGISMPLIGGLVAYYMNANSGNIEWTYPSSLVLLVVSSLLAIFNIHTLINEIHAGNFDAIMGRFIRGVNVATLFTFFSGISFGILYIVKNPIAQSGATSITSIIIERNKVIVPKDTTIKVDIETDSNGVVNKVKVNP
tara:strand:- start:3410 stop:3880 length:471 start_codon:yes stop_codon:yes gene_type:complete